MKLLTRADIFKRFTELVGIAKKIDISVAWITDADPLNILRSHAIKNKIKTRVIVGLDGNSTRPTAIDSLLQFADIRGVEGDKGIFHPKMYIFYADSKTFVWIGSANFTNSGFYRNEEIVSEISLSHEEAIRWFETRWKSIDKKESEKILQRYKDNWKPTRPVYKPSQANTTIPTENEFTLNAGLNCSWGEYLDRIEQRNDYWLQTTKDYPHPFSVTEDTSSYMETIADGNNMIVNYQSWDKISYIESVMLLGINDNYGVHGLLGSMNGAGTVVNVFTEASSKNLRIRQAILLALKKTLSTTNKQDYIKSAQEAIAEIVSFDRFGIGVATRLLALARPDMAVSVNGAACDGLARLSGLKPGTIMNWHRYANLLNWLYSLDWYNSPMPPDPWERAIWSRRAALIDCFVYTERQAKNHSRLN